jgi:hypothetical protein
MIEQRTTIRFAGAAPGVRPSPVTGWVAARAVAVAADPAPAASG